MIRGGDDDDRVLGGVGLDVVVGQTGGKGCDTGSGDVGDTVLSIEDRVTQLCYGG